MPVEHTSGSIVFATQTCSTRAELVGFINTQLQNAGWTTDGISLGYKLTSAQTPQGLQFKVLVEDNAETSGSDRWIRLRVCNMAEDKISAASTAAGSIYACTNTGSPVTILANRHQFFLFEQGGYTQYRYFSCGVPFLPTPLVPKVITNATAASPIVVTSTAHGFVNGDIVYCAGVNGVGGINSLTHTVANAATNTFELSGSTGTGAYTSGGVVGKINGQIAEAIWCCDGSNASWGVFRNRLNAVTGHSWSCLNGSAIGSGGDGGVMVATLRPSGSQTIHNIDLLLYNNSYSGNEPLLMLSTNALNLGKICGQLWDSFLSSGNTSMDQSTSSALDGTHYYYSLTANAFTSGATNTLWVAKN